MIDSTPPDKGLPTSKLESRVMLVVGMCLWLAFAVHFTNLGELSDVHRTALGVSSFVLFPGFLVLPSAYFGPLPGLLVSLFVWVAISRKAVRNWSARKFRNLGA